MVTTKGPRFTRATMAESGPDECRAKSHTPGAPTAATAVTRAKRCERRTRIERMRHHPVHNVHKGATRDRRRATVAAPRQSPPAQHRHRGHELPHDGEHEGDRKSVV